MFKNTLKSLLFLPLLAMTFSIMPSDEHFNNDDLYNALVELHNQNNLTVESLQSLTSTSVRNSCDSLVSILQVEKTSRQNKIMKKSGVGILTGLATAILLDIFCNTIGKKEVISRKTGHPLDSITRFMFHSYNILGLSASAAGVYKCYSKIKAYKAKIKEIDTIIDKLNTLYTDEISEQKTECAFL